MLGKNGRQEEKGETEDKMIGCHQYQLSVQLLSLVQLFEIPWTAACQASLSLIISQSLPKFMSIELMMPSSHLIF